MQPHDDPLWPSFQLGDWRVDVSLNRVQRGDEQRPLRHKAMEVLVLLARHAGQTVSREQLEHTIWQGNAFVAPKAINTAVWTIRQALGDDPDAPRYVETIAKKGYRLVAPVGVLTQPAAPATQAPAAPPAGTPSAPLAEAPAESVAAARRRWPLLALPLVALITLAAWALWRAAAPGAPPSASPLPPNPRQVQALTQDPGIEYLGALSPDGRLLAYAWWQGRGEG